MATRSNAPVVEWSSALTGNGNRSARQGDAIAHPIAGKLRSRSAPFRKRAVKSAPDDDGDDWDENTQEFNAFRMLRDLEHSWRQRRGQFQAMHSDWVFRQMGTVSAQVAALTQQLRKDDAAQMSSLSEEKLMALESGGTIGFENDSFNNSLMMTPSTVAPQTPMPTPGCVETAIATAPKGPAIAAVGADDENPFVAPTVEWQLTPPRSYPISINRKCIVQSKKLIPYEAVLKQNGGIMIAITMFKESYEQFEGTMIGVMRNLAKFEKKLGKEFLNHIVITIIVDGRSHMNAEAMQKLNDYGFIDRRHLENPTVSDDTLHCFYTRALYSHAYMQFGPVHCMVVIKEKHGGKLDSHKIFLDGLCARARPEFVFLLDCATIPQTQALYKLYDAMLRNPRIGGCTGELETQRNWFNPIVSSQAFEYKISHILEKPTEHVLGFIAVLPSAFSGYRYQALTEPDGNTGESPLHKYFVGLQRQNLGPFISNMFLAEDRILCFALLARHGTSFSVAYVPGAIAMQDVPEHSADLLKQRKRWLNGSLFALFYCFLNIRKIYGSGLSRLKKTTITFEMMLMTVLTTLSLLGPGIYYVLFRMVVVSVLTTRPEQVGLKSSVGTRFADVLDYSFLFVLLIQIVFGLGNTQPHQIRGFYGATLLYFSVFQLILIGFTVVFLIHAGEMATMWIPLGAIFGLYSFAAFVHCPFDLWKVVCACPYYLLLLPLYLIVVPIRAFANIHDVSWGIAGLENSTLEANQEGFQRFRSVLFLIWTTANLLFAGILLQVHLSFSRVDVYFVRTLLFLTSGVTLFRTLCLLILKCSQWACPCGTTKGKEIARTTETAPVSAGAEPTSPSSTSTVTTAATAFKDPSFAKIGPVSSQASVSSFSSLGQASLLSFNPVKTTNADAKASLRPQTPESIAL